ncbi:fungal transcriptional regulatory protein [Phyllosticta capitalensis]|uniref:fungal-specific transcription factor domain-containing protein n=1 Tax=Phyllosticta capitalensis TaxID=121624 RepID=UPI0031316B51
MDTDTMPNDDNTAAHDPAAPLTTSANPDSETEFHDSAPHSPTETGPENTAPRPAVPMQKRRRVTRACDECRRKKIKCDGKQPCTHCTVYSYECTYDQPSNRRRNAAPQYVEALENRLKRAEALLAAILPNVNLDDPAIVAGLQEGILPQTQQGTPYTPSENAASMDAAQTTPKANNLNPQAQQREEGQLESMVRATGQLDLDEHGYWDYHGHSSGLSFVRKMREKFDFMGSGESESSPFPATRPISYVFESPKSAQDSPSQFETTSLPGGAELPPKDKAIKLCDAAINDASSLLRIVHLPTFWRNLDQMYDKSPDDYGSQEHSFLPLLYTVLALGSLFCRPTDEIDQVGYENAINDGVQYFKAARGILDIAMCRDLNGLQAVIFMILFLQSSAKLSTCYAYIGVALRSALRMGLHRSMNDRFNPIETEMRKRSFWVIRKMDVYVGALLGLPHTLNFEEVDQDLPEELDDEYITETEYLRPPPNTVSLITACNAHCTLIDILSKVVRVVYPIKTKTQDKHGVQITSYTVSYADIREIEKDLQSWMENLPSGLKPGGEATHMITRVRQLLRMAYAHTQMMLYRPFLHYVSKSPNCSSLDKRAYACASACISVSRNIIHITMEMKKRDMLNGAYWFTMYTTFFAIMTLIYFALENPESPTSREVLKEAYEGKEVLESLAKRSMAADRCTRTLKAVFNQLPERVARSHENVLAVASRKRRAQSPQRDPVVKSEYHLAEPELQNGPRRAQTFPRNASPANDESKQAHRASFPPHFDMQNAQSSPAQAHFSVVPEIGPFGYQQNVPATTSSNGYYSGLQTNLTPSPVFSQAPQPQQQYSTFSPVQNNFIDRINGLNPPIPDLSAMMFPSNDPLAYPNQPMTTYENNGFSNIINRNDASSNNGSSASHSFLDNFAPGSQQQQQQRGSGHGTPVSSTSTSQGANSANKFNALPQQPTPHHDPSHGATVDLEMFNATPFMFAQPPPQMQTNGAASADMFGGILPSSSSSSSGAPNSTAAAMRQQQQAHQQAQQQQAQQQQHLMGGASAGLDDLFSSDEWAGMFADQGSSGVGVLGQGMGMGMGLGLGFR